MTTAIDVRNVSVRYGEVRALDDVTVSIPAGRVTGLIGMNGSGKSTLFKTILGLIRPRSGTVQVAGGNSTEARKAGLIGYVPQSEDVDWAFPVSVRDVVMMGRYAHQGMTRRATAADRAAVDEAIARVELDTLADRQIGRLSGGQRKRAFVARAIAQGLGAHQGFGESQRLGTNQQGSGGILLLDEPFAGVDKRSEVTTVRVLRELAAAGTTVLVSTHDLHALPDLADEAVLLMHRVLFQGPVDEALRPENLARAFGLSPDSSADDREERA